MDKENKLILQRRGTIIMLVVCVMMAMVSCRTGSTRQSGDDLASGEDSAALDAIGIRVGDDAFVDTLRTDTVSFEKKEGICVLGLLVDFPVEGGDSLVKAVREFINDYLGGAYEGPLGDGREMVKRNGEMLYGSFMEMCGDVDEEEFNELFLYKWVQKRYETNTFVTYSAMTSEYTGGLHGIAYETGHTFCRANGKSFGYDMMKDTDSPGFKRLIKDGLKQFFGKEGEQQSMSDADLLDELVSYSGSADELPLPDSEPYMTQQGVTFVYQPYEISYYAAGRPEFTMPFNIVRPYLTMEAIELFLR